MAWSGLFYHEIGEIHSTNYQQEGRAEHQRHTIHQGHPMAKRRVDPTVRLHRQ